MRCCSANAHVCWVFIDRVLIKTPGVVLVHRYRGGDPVADGFVRCTVVHGLLMASALQPT
jgi:hypothetical protein